MFGLEWTHIGAIALMLAGVVGMLWSNREALGKLAPKFSAASGDDDTLDFQAWSRLRKRKSLQCAECQAAFKVLGAHFMEGAE